MTAARRLSILSLLLISLILGCTTAEAPSETDGDRIIYGLTLPPSGIDPHINQSAEMGIALRQVYDTLVYRHPETREFVPGLAESWIVAEDGLSIDFKLREDVTFHDGTPLNAEAVGANIARIMDPDTASQRARPLLGPLTSYQIVDEYTIRLILSEPFAPLLDSLSQIYTGIASPLALAEYSGEDLVLYQFHQVGTGPYRFVEYLPDSHIILERWPGYAWRPSFIEEVPTTETVQTIEYRFFRDPATRTIALENDEAQVMGELPPTDARAIAGNSSIELMPVAIPGQPLQFYINTQLAPTDNLAFRQALLYAVNRQAVVDAVFQGFSPPAWGPLSSATLYYNPGVVGVYDYDAGQARSLLNALGYTDADGDGIVEADGEPLTITVVQPPWGLLPEVTQLLQDQWRDIGINATIEPVPGFTGLAERMSARDYHLIAFNTFGLDPIFLNESFISTSPNNLTGYGNQELDNILREAARNSDPETRRQLYGQAQAIIMQQALILPVRDYVNINAKRRELNGILYDAYGWFPMLNNATLVTE